MAKLPSGRKVAIHCQRILEMAKLNQKDTQRYPIHRVKTVKDLSPLVDVIFFRESVDYKPTANTYHPDSKDIDENDHLEPYFSGFTLATIGQELQHWSAADQKAFAAFLRENRVQAHLQEVLECVLESQRLKPKAHIPPDLFGNLSGDKLLDIFWDMAQHLPYSETPPMPRPEGMDFDLFDLLAALCRMNGLREHEKWQASFAAILNRLEAFLQRLRDENPALAVWLQYWVVDVEELAGRMRGDCILALLAPETLAWFTTQAPQEALALQPLFTEPSIAQDFAPERAILEKAAISITPTGSAFIRGGVC